MKKMWNFCGSALKGRLDWGSIEEAVQNFMGLCCIKQEEVDSPMYEGYNRTTLQPAGEFVLWWVFQLNCANLKTRPLSAERKG
jgi:hypothetical protein